MTDAVRIGIANGIELTFCSIMSSIIVFNLFARTFLLKPKVIIIQSIERGVRHILYAHDGASRMISCLWLCRNHSQMKFLYRLTYPSCLPTLESQQMVLYCRIYLNVPGRTLKQKFHHFSKQLYYCSDSLLMFGHP